MLVFCLERPVCRHDRRSGCHAMLVGWLAFSGVNECARRLSGESHCPPRRRRQAEWHIPSIFQTLAHPTATAPTTRFQLFPENVYADLRTFLGRHWVSRGFPFIKPECQQCNHHAAPIGIVMRRRLSTFDLLLAAERRHRRERSGDSCDRGRSISHRFMARRPSTGNWCATLRQFIFVNSLFPD
jgi:hypothetical protein